MIICCETHQRMYFLTDQFTGLEGAFALVVTLFMRVLTREHL
jgi:hypothetical protein